MNNAPGAPDQGASNDHVNGDHQLLAEEMIPFNAFNTMAPELPDKATMHPERHIRPVALAMNSSKPFLLVDVGSGVSFYIVSQGAQWERIGGTTLGGATLTGLLALLTEAESYDEMLEMAERGSNGNIDKLIGDIYGSDYMGIGLRKTAVAATFGKAFSVLSRADREQENGNGVEENGEPEAPGHPFRGDDICRSLLMAVFNNIAMVSCMQCQHHDLDTICLQGSYLKDSYRILQILATSIEFYSKAKATAYAYLNEGELRPIASYSTLGQ